MKHPSSDTYFQNWTILQQKLKSSIAAKEALKDVENELKRLMAERKRIEEQDKVRSKNFELDYYKILWSKMFFITLHVFRRNKIASIWIILLSE